MASLLSRLGAFAVRRRRVVLAGWLIALVSLGGLTAAFPGAFTPDFKIPGTESQNANDLISKRVPGANPNAASGRLVFSAPNGQRITTPARKAAIQGIVAAIPGQSSKVRSASDPFQTKAISPAGRIAYSDLTFTVAPAQVTAAQTDAIERATESAKAAGIAVDYGGAAAAKEVEAPVGELLGIIVALFVLTITFGSLLTAGLPLLTGILGVGIGVLGVTLASAFTDLTQTALSLATMLGLAVGIDYTLFILSRHRTQVADGMAIDASIARAVGTAGSAVVFAGLTVVIALLGLLVTGVPFLAQMGIGAAATVAIAVLISLTFTPALLAVAGPRATKGKAFTEELSDPATGEKPTLGARWVALVIRRRFVAVGAVLALVLALASPALHMRLGLPNDGSLARDTTQRQGYDLLSEGFGPGFNGPLTIVADLKGVQNPEQVAASTAEQLRTLKGVTAVTAPVIADQAKSLAIITAIPAQGPSSKATEQLVKTIRADAGAVQRETGATISVTGQTAIAIDISERMSDSLLPYLGVVVGLALVLLLIAFRSILVPLTAIAGFLLTIVGAFGVVTLVFQDGFGASLLGVGQTGPLVSLLPILIIGVIFGLAMDYQVFLVSRMREEFTHGARATAAVRDGFRHSARVVTAAALIMIAVFSGFILPDDAIIKSIGLAFATGVLIDAFLIRMTLIPALMAILGARAWWIPRWLDRRVPNVDIEGESLGRAPTRATAAASPATT